MAESPDKDKLKKYIQNYVNFYANKHDVVVEEIFSSAAVSYEDMMRLLSYREPKLRIYLAKTSKEGGCENMTFVIAPADENGQTFLDKKGLVEDASSDCCCRHPG